MKDLKRLSVHSETTPLTLDMVGRDLPERELLGQVVDSLDSF